MLGYKERDVLSMIVSLKAVHNKMDEGKAKDNVENAVWLLEGLLVEGHIQ
jgi:hypothetical protein